MMRFVVLATVSLWTLHSSAKVLSSPFKPTPALRMASPLVLDWDRDGSISLIDAFDEERVVFFDLDGDGKVERTGWVAPNDALLAFDANGDGLITSGRELLGEFTNSPKSRAPGQKTYRNGFLALSQFDDDHDETVARGDPSFVNFYVWQDRNSDGVSQPAELIRLADTDIVSLPLAYRKTLSEKSSGSVAGNGIRIEAVYATRSGAHYRMGDGWFAVRPVDGLVSLRDQ